MCALRDMVPRDPDLGKSQSPMRTLADHGSLQVCTPRVVEVTVRLRHGYHE